MADRPYGFSEKGVQRIVNVVRDAETAQKKRNAREIYQHPNWQHVRCTGDALESAGSGSDGPRYWPGEVVVWDAENEVEIIIEECWIYVWNNYRLKVGGIYDARESGRLSIDTGSGGGSGSGDDERTVFVVSAAAAFPDSVDEGSGGGGGDGSGTGSGGAGCQSGIPISDLIKCNAGKTQIVDGCLDWTDGHIVLRDTDGTIIAGG